MPKEKSAQRSGRSPHATRVSRQVERAEKRKALKGRKDGKAGLQGRSAQKGRGETVGAIAILVISVGFSIAALISDARAFWAVDTPSYYCWLALSALCTVGIVLTVRARRANFPVPLYFRLLLVLGVLAGVLTVSPAIRVLTKDDAKAEQPLAETNVDLRNRHVEEVSYAGRVLRHSDFSGATLDHVDLSGANLAESDFRNATFEDVDLSGAVLCGADLRGADLRGAEGLDAVADWSYVFFDGRTRVPKSVGFLLLGLPGPIEDTGRDLLYMCSAGQVRRIES
jgi:hypothetical protein